MKFYPSGYEFEKPVSQHDTVIYVDDKDTLGAAAMFEKPCCLNFASHRRPGGGYKSVADLRMIIKTQEEDLFRRSNLPELMDTPEVRKRYPLRNLESFYTDDIFVTKGPLLENVSPFEISVITMPALVNPTASQNNLTLQKISRILDIAVENKAKYLILGAWGCGVFRNDPEFVATGFMKCLNGDFKGVFDTVVFAIPGATSTNHQIFKSVIQ